jgi:hypothetical protein
LAIERIQKTAAPNQYGTSGVGMTSEAFKYTGLNFFELHQWVKSNSSQDSGMQRLSDGTVVIPGTGTFLKLPPGQWIIREGDRFRSLVEANADGMGLRITAADFARHGFVRIEAKVQNLKRDGVPVDAPYGLSRVPLDQVVRQAFCDEACPYQLIFNFKQHSTA